MLATCMLQHTKSSGSDRSCTCLHGVPCRLAGLAVVHPGQTVSCDPSCRRPDLRCYQGVGELSGVDSDLRGCGLGFSSGCSIPASASMHCSCRDSTPMVWQLFQLPHPWEPVHYHGQHAAKPLSGLLKCTWGTWGPTFATLGGLQHLDLLGGGGGP
jgi:hypothetical protein